MLFLVARRLFTDTRTSIELIFSSVFIAILGLASSLYSIQVLNRYLSLGIDSTLVTLSVGALMSVVFEYWMRDLRLRRTLFSFEKEDVALTDAVYQHAANSRLRAWEAIPGAERRSALQAVTLLSQHWSATSCLSLIDLPFSLIFLAVLYFLSPVLAMAASCIILLHLLLALTLSRMQRPVSDNQTQRLQSVNGIIGTLLQNGELLRTLGGGARMKQLWQQARQALFVERNRLMVLAGAVQNLGQSGSMLMSIVIMGLGAREVFVSDLNVGTLIGANILASRALANVSRFAQSLEAMRKGHEAYTSMQSLLALELIPDQGIRLDEVMARIQVEDVSFAYPGMPTPLFENLSLSLPEGSVTVVTGNNGTGRTALMRILSGAIEPDRGRVRLDGMDLRQLSPEWWSQLIGVVPDDPLFFDGSLRDNMCIQAQDISDDELLTLCRKVRVATFVERNPKGLEMLIQDGGRSIPLGIRKRLALVRALAHKPKIVYLDGPTDSADTEACAGLAEVLNDLAKSGCTLVVASNEGFIANAAHQRIDLNFKPQPKVSVRQEQGVTVASNETDVVGASEEVNHGE